MSNLKFAETHNLVAFLEKPKESNRFEGIIDFLNASSIRYALTVNPTIYTSCIKQFWATAKAKTVNGEVQIQALVDGKKVIVTETSVRRSLQLKDAEGTECLLNAIIFEQLTLIGAKTTAWNEFSSTMASTIILFLDKQVEGMTKHKEIYVTHSYTKKVFANMKRGGKGFSRRVTPLFQTMMVQAPEDLEPITDEAANEEHERVKKLERRNKSKTLKLKRFRKVGRSVQVVSSEDEGLGAQEDASKQGRKIADLDADAEVTLVDEAQEKNDDNLMFDTDVLYEQEVEVEKVTLIDIKAAKPKVVTTAATTTTTAVTRPKARGVDKDKGKAKMIELEKPLKKKDKILMDEEIAQKLQAQLNVELEEEKLAKQREEDANIVEWE
ncbi:hypothetical protein Tco_0493695 [Tanacetum coccineum]